MPWRASLKTRCAARPLLQLIQLGFSSSDCAEDGDGRLIHTGADVARVYVVQVAILSQLEHPNIVQVRPATLSSRQHVASPCDSVSAVR